MTESPAVVPAPRFIAIGGVWLDEIKKDGKTLHENVLGGSVTYATLGARLFVPTDPGSIRLLMIKGKDSPPDVIDTMRGWRVCLRYLPHDNASPAARGILHYGKDESDRHYERLTAPLNTSVDDLENNDLLHATSFHFFDIPATIRRSTSKIFEARQEQDSSSQAPLIVWEPQAKSCSPETLEEHLSAAMSVDVFSPNHMELASFFAEDHESSFSRDRVVRQAKVFVESGIGAGKGCAVIRCAEHGAVVMSRTTPPTWLPAYYEPSSQRVVSSTGAGNAFLGSFAIGYQNTSSYIEAAKYGAVGASFMVEQVGPPTLTGGGINELWNHASVQSRLKNYLLRY